MERDRHADQVGRQPDVPIQSSAQPEDLAQEPDVVPDSAISLVGRSHLEPPREISVMQTEDLAQEPDVVPDSAISLLANSTAAPSQVIALVRDAMRAALDSSKRLADDTVGPDYGVSIDLSRKNIGDLPDEALDIIAEDVVRSVHANRASK